MSPEREVEVHGVFCRIYECVMHGWPIELDRALYMYISKEARSFADKIIDLLEQIEALDER
jgi:hypothetical protein